MIDDRTISLIICTYMRPHALKALLDSVEVQTSKPDEILIIDGSTNQDTEIMLQAQDYSALKYYSVPPEHRGLTRQRNYGVDRVGGNIDIVCFLDDDTILEPDYFKEILDAYKQYPVALGVGGFITNEVTWQKATEHMQSNQNFYCYDGFCRKESSRWKLRKKLGLYEDLPPAIYPKSGHGRSISSLPPSGKIYEVEQLMGGVSSFPLDILKQHKFSEYFDGYGLYEDADFTLRLSHLGKLYINTRARLEHHHDAAGRPNKYKYGKMVVRNGWYVWKVKHPKVQLKSALKWYAISILQIVLRGINALNTKQRKEAMTETLGRLSGLCSLFSNPPKVQNAKVK
jgi:glycosyltransferase involved in cell wall biosynthesis